MKYRVIDLLKCSCGNSGFKVIDPTVKEVSFGDGLTKVCCKSVCGFKSTSTEGGNITPGDCKQCYGVEVIEGVLRCNCGKEYPIIRSIPRILENISGASIKKTQEAFSWEWKMFRSNERN